MSRILISAAHKSSGKTLLTMGLAAAFRHRGLHVQTFKKGPDYIDPLWLSEASGRPCRNLDFHTMSVDEITASAATHAVGADVSLIEGNHGLYDGLDLDGSNSNAALATLLGTPVVLVLDARGMTRGIAPLILGYQAFDPTVRIRGIILNRIGGSRHEAKLRAIIEHYTDARVLGAVHRDRDLEIAERHLGLVPTPESPEAVTMIGRAAETAARQVDLDQLLEVAADAAPLKVPAAPEQPAETPTTVRIGIARDSAFCFYYPGDLEALQAAGAELVPFNTMTDRRLPPLDGLFMGGGFPETHMAALAANHTLLRGVYDAITGGLPAYAECGGLMYLARSLSWQGETADMAGVIPADVVMHEAPQGRGYVRLRETGAGPWPAPDDADGRRAEIPAHEFHYSSLENLEGPPIFAYEVLRGSGIDGRHDGLVIHNLLASYAHMRDVAHNRWAGRFVAFVAACKEKSQDTVRARA